MKKNNPRKLVSASLSLAFILPLFSSCSVNKLAARKTSEIIDTGMPAVFRETDLDFAREAIPSNLKLMEILMETDRNEKFLFYASMGFCGYAFGFLEDENVPRATSFYQKGLAYSDELLERAGVFKNGKFLPEKSDKKNAPYLFWNTFCKSGLMNINRDNPDMVAMMGEIEAQAERLAEIYPEYYWNSVYTILGSMNASKPRILGGNPEKAKEYFEKAVAGNGKDFLLNYLMYAKTYAVMIQDPELFDRLTDRITTFKIQPSDNALFNALAAEKAAKLKEKKNELF